MKKTRSSPERGLSSLGTLVCPGDSITLSHILADTGVWKFCARRQCPSVKHQASGKVLTITASEGAGPAVWRRPCAQTECKQAASWEAKIAVGPLCLRSHLSSCLKPGLDSSCQPHSTKFLASILAEEACLDHLSSFHTDLFQSHPNSLNKVGLGNCH